MRLAMSSKTIGIDADYLLIKQRQLLSLKDELERVSDAAEREETVLRSTSREAREYEDDAAEMDQLERQGLLVNRSLERLARVDRALAKIANGSYGYSDESGQRISDERLELMPEATNTLEEQQIAEREVR
jgi:DnaK suppressor protein